MQLIALPGLGPKSAELLSAANIRDVATLKELGAAAAFVRVQRVRADASLNLLWALEGALTGRHWQEVAKHDRTRLLMLLDDLQRGQAEDG